MEIKVNGTKMLVYSSFRQLMTAISKSVSKFYNGDNPLKVMVASSVPLFYCIIQTR